MNQILILSASICLYIFIWYTQNNCTAFLNKFRTNWLDERFSLERCRCCHDSKEVERDDLQNELPTKKFKQQRDKSVFETKLNKDKEFICTSYHILHQFFSQIVVNAVDLWFLEQLSNLSTKSFWRFQILAKGLFNYNPSPATEISWKESQARHS